MILTEFSFEFSPKLSRDSNQRWSKLFDSFKLQVNDPLSSQVRSLDRSTWNLRVSKSFELSSASDWTDWRIAESKSSLRSMSFHVRASCPFDHARTCPRDEILRKVENDFPRFTLTFSDVARVNQLAVSYLDPQRNSLGDDRRDSHSANFVNQRRVVIIFFRLI